MNAGSAPRRGLRCPQCQAGRFRTTHTEPLPDDRIRRRKVCRQCGHRIVTYEGKLTSLRAIASATVHGQDTGPSEPRDLKRNE